MSHPYASADPGISGERPGATRTPYRSSFALAGIVVIAGLLDAGVAHEGMVARHERPDFQILAQFAERSAARVPAHAGGGATELAVKGGREVAVARKTEFEGQRGEV